MPFAPAARLFSDIKGMIQFNGHINITLKTRPVTGNRTKQYDLPDCRLLLEIVL